MLREEIPDDVQPMVCGTSLTVHKPKNSIRPIADGETLRRLRNNAAIELTVRSILEPVPLGYANQGRL